MTISFDDTVGTRQRTGSGRPGDLEGGIPLGIRPSYQSLPRYETVEERPQGLFRDAGAAVGAIFLSPKKRKRIGVIRSLKAIACSSSLNLFIVFIPLAWVAHFVESWNHSHSLTFILCFLAIVPLEHIFDWGGEQIALYCGKDLGDLLVITLNNIVEATLAIILLVKCQLKLLHSTIVGVVVLHLLLVPGTAFITGGARVTHQDLHADLSQLNHSLLTIGVMSLLLPAAFFSALDHGVPSQVVSSEAGESAVVGNLINDTTRDHFLTISRGIAIILLVVYIFSRVYLHNPPPPPRDRPQSVIHSRQVSRDDISVKHEEGEPKANPWVLIVVLLIAIGIMAATTEFLVESVEVVREQGRITDEWFGMILLPLISFAANGFVAIIYFVRYMLRHFLKEPSPPEEFAKARAIDLSIQFTLFWMPFFVLLGWWTGKPFTLLFDFYEIAVLLGSCFIVNYVTADAKTNWAEGLAMVAFYFMIGLTTWFYTGQPEIRILLGCGSVEENIAKFASGAAEGHH